jgi:hypothetical protein
MPLQCIGIAASGPMRFDSATDCAAWPGGAGAAAGNLPALIIFGSNRLHSRFNVPSRKLFAGIR